MVENWKPIIKPPPESPYPRDQKPPLDSRLPSYPIRPGSLRKPLKPTRGSRRSR